MEFKNTFVQLIRNLNARGHSPATSTNYSFLDDTNHIWITKSGIDKSEIDAKDFIQIDRKGNPLQSNEIPSAETKIHCSIYSLHTDAKVVLHSHSIYPVLLSSLRTDTVCFSEYEIQKGFKGLTTHAQDIHIPIFENSQEMDSIVAKMEERVLELNRYALILRKHGVYVWGASLQEAKRHLETLEYLCECEYKLACVWQS